MPPASQPRKIIPPCGANGLRKPRGIFACAKRKESDEKITRIDSGSRSFHGNLVARPIDRSRGDFDLCRNRNRDRIAYPSLPHACSLRERVSIQLPAKTISYTQDRGRERGRCITRDDNYGRRGNVTKTIARSRSISDDGEASAREREGEPREDGPPPFFTGERQRFTDCREIFRRWISEVVDAG